MAVEIPNLPIREKEQELRELIEKHQVIVVAGETGSGKTTQLPRICHEMGFAEKGRIAVTQPRRIAATSTAQRVADEMGVSLGTTVGYKIRFAEKVSDESEILFLTDGMLLNELGSDKRLSRYSVIIIDEVHERSLNIDFLLGYFRKLVKIRPELKIIISSATIDTELFSKAFDDAPILEVSGRMFPVEVMYDPVEESDSRDYIDQAVLAVEQIIGSEMGGDILIFMPTERDIRELQERLSGKRFDRTVVLPLFARLTREQQNRIFHKMSDRKVVIATNIAETSITVPGIRFVVDSGLARLNRYSPSLRTNRLPVEMISQAEAKQRMGRCGRVAEGVCIRLYSEADYNTMDEYRTAEIRRSNLAGVILALLNFKLGSIEKFPFLEVPEQRAISDAFSQLYELSAIDKDKKLTRLGYTMSKLPLEPHVSRMILQASREGVVDDVAVICAGLSIVDPRERPQEQAEAADKMHEKFLDHRSDFLTLLKLWNTYHTKLESLKTQNKMRKYCKEHFLNFNRIREWMDVYKQIRGILKERKIRGRSEFGSEASFANAIHRSILAGLVSSIAKFDSEAGAYRATRNRLTHIFPGSVLAKKKNKHEWIMAQEIVETSRVFARSVAPIDPRWVEDFVPHLLSKRYGVPFYKEERESVIVEERLLFSGLTIVEGRNRYYGNINMKEAKEIFIQNCLVEGRMINPFPFLKKNLYHYNQLRQDEAKLRTTGYLISDEQLVELYNERLPDVASVKDLRSHIRKVGNDKFLLLKREDFIIEKIPEKSREFPKSFALGDKEFPLTYNFEPGSESDGVTVHVPLGEVAFIEQNSFGWLVRPLWPEKISALLKTLPKSERKAFVPMNESSKRIASAMNFSSKGFIIEMIDAIRREYGTLFKEEQFDTEALPEHLQMRIVVEGKKGKVIKTTRDTDELSGLNKIGVESAGSSIVKRLKKLEEKGIKEWDFGTLPKQKEVSKSKDGLPLYGYPALKAEEKSVTLRYMADPAEAQKVHRDGVVKLLEITLQKDIDWLDKDLKFPKALKVEAAPYGGVEKLKKRLADIILEEVLSPPVELPMDKATFDTLYEKRRALLVKAGHGAIDVVSHTFKQLRENRALIAKLAAKSNGKHRQVLADELIAEMDLYLEQFTDGFMPYGLLIQFARYMKAFYFRIEKAFTATAKYRKQEALLLSWQEKVVDLVENYEKSNSTHKRNVLLFMEMVEEFGVLLFAHPEMKPGIPVSEKRLEKLLSELEER